MTEIFGTVGICHSRGFAFVKRDDGGSDVFCAARELDGRDIDTGVFERRVSFDIATREDGKRYAHNVNRID
jgi:cold shock CspA family protein